MVAREYCISVDSSMQHCGSLVRCGVVADLRPGDIRAFGQRFQRLLVISVVANGTFPRWRERHS